VQVPPPQVPVPQDWPQAPQFAALICVSTQAPAQQDVPPPQTIPQPPQFCGSEETSMQRSPQCTDGERQRSFFGEHPATTKVAARMARTVARFTDEMIA
jgi:hypothetical protein